MICPHHMITIQEGMLVSDIRPPPLKYAAQVLTDLPEDGQLFSLTGQVRRKIKR